MLTNDEITTFCSDNSVEWVRAPLNEVPVLSDHDPGWAATYATIAGDIRAMLAGAADSVEHVGSTAVPGLVAKPVIDIDLTIADPTAEDDYIPRLEAAGFRFEAREPGWYQHRLLVLVEPRVNLHVFGPESAEAVRHRILRDWLIAHPADRAEYAEAKRAALGPGTVMDYNQRKEATIRKIYHRAFRSLGLI